VNNIDLSRSYVLKARSRLKALKVLFDDGDFSDVLRESQEAVGLATKAMLRSIGIDPPKWHDVSSIISEYIQRFPAGSRPRIDEVMRISKSLRKERELSFYGDIDFIPTEEYTKEQAEQAMRDAEAVISLAEGLVLGARPI
jgi:HEPN domain-containing protein